MSIPPPFLFSCLLTKRPGSGRATPSRLSVAFTLVELLVVIAIISVLAALLLPSVKSSIRKSQESVCANNLRQIGVACLGYAADTGYLPVGEDTSGGTNHWRDNLVGAGYIPDYRVTVCPTLLRKDQPVTAKKTSGNQGYGMVHYTDGWASLSIRPAQIAKPSTYAMMADSVNMTGYGIPTQICFLTGDVNQVDRRHADRANVLFADGHVEALSESQIQLLGHDAMIGANFWASTNTQK